MSMKVVNLVRVPLMVRAMEFELGILCVCAITGEGDGNPPSSALRRIVNKVSNTNTGRLHGMLRQKGITVKVIKTIQDVNKVFGKKYQRNT